MHPVDRSTIKTLRTNDGTWPVYFNLSFFFLISLLLQNNWPLVRAKASDSRSSADERLYQHAEDRYKISRQRETLFADVTNASCLFSFISLSLIGAIFSRISSTLPTFSHVAELSRDNNWRKIFVSFQDFTSRDFTWTKRCKRNNSRVLESTADSRAVVFWKLRN